MRHLPLAALFFLACDPGTTNPKSHGKSGNPGDTSATADTSDADTDADGDTDADADADTDADTDTGGDSATDTGGDTGPEAKGVVVPGPSLVIRTPSSANRIESDAATLSFAGTADTTALSVTWSDSTGGAGSAGGLTDWTADVPLTEGIQTVTFSAVNADGVATDVAVVVGWQPDMDFDGRPTLSATTVAPGAAVTGSLAFTSTSSITDVQLAMDCYAGGRFTQTLAPMSNAAGTWSGTANAPATPDDCVVGVHVTTDKGDRQSETTFLRVRDPLSAAEAADLTGLLSDVGDAMQVEADWTASVTAGEAILSARTDILSMAADERGLFWRTTDGSLFGAIPAGSGTTWGGSEDPLLPWVLQTYRPGEVLPGLDTDPLIGWSARVSCLAPIDIRPYGYDLDKSSDVISNIASMEAGLIRFIAHGGIMPGGLAATMVSTTTGVWYLPWWYPTSSAGGDFYMQLASDVPAADLPSYLMSGGWVDEGAVVVVDTTGVNTLSVLATPALFDDQIPANALTGGVVIATSCESAANGSLSSVLFDKGASVYIGYDDVVDSRYTADFETALFNRWLPSYDTTAAYLPLEGLDPAFSDAFAALGDRDDDTYVEAVYGVAPDDTPALPQIVWNGPEDVEAKCCGGLFGGLSSDATIPGSRASGRFGYSVAGVGDVDGDLVVDLAVGRPAGGAGEAFVLSGRTFSTAVAAKTSLDPAGLAIATFDSGGAGDQIGNKVAATGDVTLDGLPDVMIGAPFDDTLATDAGAVIILGWDGVDLVEVARVEGDYASAEVGYVLAGSPLAWRERDHVIGDVSGDGEADIVFGSPYARSDSAGSVYIFFGPVSGTKTVSDADADIFGTRTGAQAAYDAAIIGDMDGDGVSELAVRGDKSSTANATVQIFQGPLGAHSYLTSTTYSWVELKGSSTSESLKVAGAGDTDADGHDDVVVGSNTLSKGYIVLGSTTLSDLTLSSGADATYTGTSGAAAGWAVSSAGDTDCDRKDDVLFGAPSDSSSAGAFCLALGPFSGAITCTGEDSGPAGSSLGYALAGAGDLDGHGCEDVAIGAYLGSTAAASAGDVYLYTGE